MSFDYEEKASTSRFVDVFWQTFDRTDGTYLAAADACWDMIFIRGGGGIRALLSGPSSNITPVPYKAGNRNVGIRFVRGSFLTHVPATVMVDTTVVLPMADEGSFVLAGQTWPVPTYEAVEDFVAGLEQRRLLSDDPLVLAALRGDRPSTSSRSLQRHFLQVTGLTEKRIRTIVRARAAAEMLQRGLSILDVTHELGYADQAHLTRDLRELTGYTPGETKDRNEPI